MARRAQLVCLILFSMTTFMLSQSNSSQIINKNVGMSLLLTTAKQKDRYGKLPLSFEENYGQTDPKVKFLCHGSGYSVFLTSNEAVLALSSAESESRGPKITRPSNSIRSKRNTGAALSMKLLNASLLTRVKGLKKLTGTSNYFVGNDPTRWRRDVPMYAEVKYESIYPGVDLVYYGNQNELEYDFIVAAGNDPRRIEFDIRGAKKFHRNKEGELIFNVADREIRWHAPTAYQVNRGKRQPVESRYVVRGKDRFGFEIGSFDSSLPLYVDPLIYSTFLGGGLSDSGNSIAIDQSGNTYVTGSTNSYHFPTQNPIQADLAGSGYNFPADAFVTKLDPTGTSLIFSTYLGGSAYDHGTGIAVDGDGYVYVTGSTFSVDFPVANAFQPVLSSGQNAFVSKLVPAGSAFVYSTYLGGSGGSSGAAISVDNSGDAFVTGIAIGGFPVTPGAFQTELDGQSDAFVSKLNADGSSLLYSTFLGGSGIESATGIVLDSLDNAYVTGYTASSDFPTTPGAFETIGSDAFVSKLNSTGSGLVYSTYLDGSSPTGIALDSAYDVFVTGSAWPPFVVTSGAFETTCQDQCGFVTKINPAGSAQLYSTYLGLGGDYPQGITIDPRGNAYVTGWTQSVYFPTKNKLKGSKPSGYDDAFVTKLDPTGSFLIWSTYLGGSKLSYGYGLASDGLGDVFVTGLTQSSNFPTTSGAFQRLCNGNGLECFTGDAFITKMNIAAPTTNTLSSSPNPSSYGEVVSFLATVSSNPGGPPDGETISFMKGKSILGTAPLSHGQATFTTSELPIGINAVTAVYGGDLDFLSSRSVALRQTVHAAEGSIAEVSPASVNFGDVIVGQTSPQVRVSLKNEGDSEIVIASISISGYFALPVNHCAAGVRPGTHCDVYVTFSPHAVEVESGVLTFTDNASNSPQSVSLSGNGVNSR
jgi:hypothetical protein